MAGAINAASLLALLARANSSFSPSFAAHDLICNLPKALENVEGAEEIFKQGGMIDAIPSLLFSFTATPDSIHFAQMLLATTSFRQLSELESYQNLNFLFTVNPGWSNVLLLMRSSSSTADDDDIANSLT